MWQDTIVFIASCIIAFAIARNFPRWAYNAYKHAKSTRNIFAKPYVDLYEIFTEGT